jgi:ADP-ribose pyrophosphatase
MEFYEKKIKTETVYKGIIVNVRRDIAELQNGSHADREIVEHPGGVGIVPLTKDNKVLMVRQFRYPMMEEVLEIPAGKLNDGEDPFECAVRELSEETGCTAGRYIDLGASYPSPGYCGEILHIYLALDLRYGEKHLDVDELLSVEAIAIDDLIKRIMANELPDGKTMIGIMKAKRFLESQKEEREFECTL